MAGIQVDGANQKVVLDSDGDTYLEAATDDTIKVYVAGAHDATISANAINVLSGTTLTIDSGATITNSGTANGFSSADPASADGDSLGTASLEWSDLFLADGGIIKFGNDQDVLLTHVADTGLLLNGTNVIQFNDASQNIGAPSATVLDINATDEIELNATAVDLNGTLDVSGNSQFSGTITVGVDDTGKDVKLFGATSGSYLEWDESADDLNLIASGIGVTTAKDLGTGIHIRTADSGASVNSNFDELVIEGSGNSGMSILSGASSEGAIFFGDSGSNAIGRIEYSHANNTMAMTVNATTALFIRDDGEVLVGGTTSTNSKLMVTQANAQSLARFHATDDSNTATLFKILCDNTTGGDYNSFNIDKDGTSVLNIEGDGDVKNTNNSYGAISDERIKKDITDAKSQWDDIKALKIKNYKLKTDSNSPTQLGVIAQDLETDGMSGLVKDSRPEAYLVNSHSDFGTLVDGTADNGAEEIHDKDGKITGYEKVFTEGQKVKSVKYSVLYMKAIKCLQEAQTKIESLETRVKTLEDA